MIYFSSSEVKEKSKHFIEDILGYKPEELVDIYHFYDLFAPDVCEDLKKAEFMIDKVGQQFQGTISSITSFGLFVELDNTIEGLVRLSSMDDDYYNYNERAICLIGERTKKIYRIGDKVNVQLIKASTEARQIDFIIIDENEGSESRSEKKEPELIRAKSVKDNERLLKHIGATSKKKKDSRSQKSRDSKNKSNDKLSGNKKKSGDKNGYN